MATKKLKVLNLYAGIGGNRKLWPDDEIEVTAVEYDREIADLYKELFPQDTVICCDAHQFLVDHYDRFDFIWSSPPCPTHSRFNLPLEKKRYPSMKLYEEILFLKHFFKGKWVVENVTSYYDPMIEPFVNDGHYFWTNFKIENNKNIRNLTGLKLHELAKERMIDFDWLKSKTKKYELIINNCVLPNTGLRIFNMAFKEPQQTLTGS